MHPCLWQKNFPDSDIAQSYHSARTKTACILNHAVAPDLKRQLVAAMQEQPYSLSTDASSDTVLSKMNPLTVLIFDVNRNVVTLQFLDLCLTSGEDAGRAFDKINDTLSELNIPWSNCTSFGVDNTNTNIGAKNSLKSRTLEKNPAIYFAGCPCQIIHNAAQNFRWFSLQKAVERILKLYTLSRTYFLSEGLKEARFIRLLKLYENPHVRDLPALLPSSSARIHNLQFVLAEGLPPDLCTPWTYANPVETNARQIHSASRHQGHPRTG